jgi:hypothetical protein
MLPKLNESSFRGLMWICTSIVIGVVLATFGASKGLFRNPDTRLLERGVFVGLWLATVVGGIALLRRTNRAAAETA